MNNGLITFNGEVFPFRELILFKDTENERLATVAGESLWEALKPYVEDKSNSLWGEATNIDDSIEYYVKDEDLSKDYFPLTKQVEIEAYG